MTSLQIWFNVMILAVTFLGLGYAWGRHGAAKEQKETKDVWDKIIEERNRAFIQRTELRNLVKSILVELK